MSINEKHDDNRFYLTTGDGNKIEVSEAIYHAYWDKERAEERRRRREYRCRDGKGFRCNKNCETCPIFLYGDGPTGNPVSLDALFDQDEYEVEGNENVEETVLLAEMLQDLLKAISSLDERGQKTIRMLMDKKTAEEIMSVIGIKALSWFKEYKKKLFSLLYEQMQDWR